MEQKNLNAPEGAYFLCLKGMRIAVYRALARERHAFPFGEGGFDFVEIEDGRGVNTALRHPLPSRLRRATLPKGEGLSPINDDLLPDEGADLYCYFLNFRL